MSTDLVGLSDLVFNFKHLTALFYVSNFLYSAINSILLTVNSLIHQIKEQKDHLLIFQVKLGLA